MNIHESKISSDWSCRSLNFIKLSALKFNLRLVCIILYDLTRANKTDFEMTKERKKKIHYQRRKRV